MFSQIVRFYTFFLDNLHQISHAHVLLAEGVILIKRLVAAMLTGRTAHRTQQKPPRRPKLPVPAGRLFAFMKRRKTLRGLRRWSG